MVDSLPFFGFPFDLPPPFLCRLLLDLDIMTDDVTLLAVQLNFPGVYRVCRLFRAIRCLANALVRPAEPAAVTSPLLHCCQPSPHFTSPMHALPSSSPTTAPAIPDSTIAPTTSATTSPTAPNARSAIRHIPGTSGTEFTALVHAGQFINGLCGPVAMSVGPVVSVTYVDTFTWPKPLLRGFRFAPECYFGAIFGDARSSGVVEYELSAALWHFWMCQHLLIRHRVWAVPHCDEADPDRRPSFLFCDTKHSCIALCERSQILPDPPTHPRNLGDRGVELRRGGSHLHRGPDAGPEGL